MLFWGSYFHNYKKKKDHYLSLGWAYASTAVVITFFLVDVLGIIFTVIGRSHLWDEYVLFDEGSSFVYLYVAIMAIEYYYFNYVLNFEAQKQIYQRNSWLQSNTMNIVVIPFVLTGFTLLILAIYVP
jgi:hypothetical protein